MFKVNRTLVTVNLGDNSISDVGGNALGAALKENTSIKTLR